MSEAIFHLSQSHRNGGSRNTRVLLVYAGASPYDDFRRACILLRQNEDGSDSLPKALAFVPHGPTGWQDAALVVPQQGDLIVERFGSALSHTTLVYQIVSVDKTVVKAEPRSEYAVVLPEGVLSALRSKERETAHLLVAPTVCDPATAE